jgi:dinuclear metal center YbgI/SA1388 family protein
MNGQEFKKIFEEHFPLDLAYDWDNVGLQVGTLNKQITSILISLDLTKEVMEEALNLGCNLIVLHHPVIFSPVKKILTDGYLGSLIATAIKNDITLYVAHTNFDISKMGMNQNLANLLGLTNQKVLEYTTEELGLGKIGEIEEVSLDAFISHVKNVFALDSIKLIGPNKKTVKTVAISGGSGSSLLRNRILKDVDVFITGDISYHYALDALNAGLTVLDVGHNIEKLGLITLQEFLNEQLEATVYLSSIDTNPYISK